MQNESFPSGRQRITGGASTTAFTGGGPSFTRLVVHSSPRGEGERVVEHRVGEGG